jgi:hypothetical protein
MGNAVLYMSMSLDGFVAGPNVSTEQPVNDGRKLTPWRRSPRPGGALRTQLDSTVITADLDRLEQRQQADGGWVVDFRSYSPAADLEWRGYATVEALSILHHNGRLASSGG